MAKTKRIPAFVTGDCCGIRTMCKPIRACPNGAVVWTPKKGSKMKGIISFDYDRCTACGECVEACRLGILKLFRKD